MSTIFTKIINGEIPSYKIAEDEKFYAFLDLFPLAKGHTLVIPKEEVDYIYDFDEVTYMGLQAFARKIALALDKAIPCKKVGVAVLGLEVPHAHIHLVPMQSEADINFKNPKKKFTPDEFEEIRKTIVDQL
ncbi:MAG: HIT family protein [Prolixibacteraceae bacterium]|jgi:histidine triad (HIT) family protein|nr:HIT family protein [Prolixibacteraceae bacterium]